MPRLPQLPGSLLSPMPQKRAACWLRGVGFDDVRCFGRVARMVGAEEPPEWTVSRIVGGGVAHEVRAACDLEGFADSATGMGVLVPGFETRLYVFWTPGLGVTFELASLDEAEAERVWAGVLRYVADECWNEPADRLVLVNSRGDLERHHSGMVREATQRSVDLLFVSKSRTPPTLTLPDALEAHTDGVGNLLAWSQR
ncbi:MAG: hypothetical protein AAGE52_21080 [Myxococcota bacterium]